VLQPAAARNQAPQNRDGGPKSRTEPTSDPAPNRKQPGSKFFHREESIIRRDLRSTIIWDRKRMHYEAIALLKSCKD